MDPSSLDLLMTGFERTLDGIYTDMLKLTAQFVNLGRAVGAFGALLYISSRVWGHLIRTEPIDFYPLLRPFAIGLAILLFPQLCGSLRGVTMAVSHGTDAIRLAQQKEVASLTKDRDKLAEEKHNAAVFQINQENEEKLKGLGQFDLGQQTKLAFNQVQYTVGQNFREWIKDILELAAMAAKLAISLISTFLLIILSVAGPLAFGIAIIPGFGGGIMKWLGYFITISFWVPVANIYATMLSHVQIMLLKRNIEYLQTNNSPDVADMGYLLLLVLAIVGYIMVPKAADMLVDGSGVGSAASSFMIGAAVGSSFGQPGGQLGGVAGAATGAAGMAGAGAGMAARGAMGMGQRAASAVREQLKRS